MKKTPVNIVKSRVAKGVMIASLGMSFSPMTMAQQNDFEFEEVIVTATRSSKSLQDVPIAVTVNTGEDLQKKAIVDGTAVGSVSPSINFARTTNSHAGPTLIIRGIGTVGTGRTFEGSVGVFIDGVYRSRPGHILNTFLDVSNLQVLRGPQGTLFGKNNTAGAMLLESNKPLLGDEVTGNYNLAVGDYGYYRAQGAVNVPLSDTSAFRIAASIDDREGYFEDVNSGGTEGDTKTNAFRLSYYTSPTENLELTLTADYSKREALCCYGVGNIVPSDLSGLVSALTGGNPYPVSEDPFDRRVSLNTLAEDIGVDQGVNLNIELDDVLGGSISGIFSVRNWDAENTGFDSEYSPLDVLVGNENFESDTVSAEIIYNVSPSENVNLLAGLYYSKEDITIDRFFENGADAQNFWNILLPSALAGTGLDTILTLGGRPGGNATQGQFTDEVMTGENTSLGVFVRSEIDFTDRFSGFAGIRYSEDEKNGTHVDNFGAQHRATTLGFFGNLGVGNIPGAIAAAPNLEPFALFGILPTSAYNDTFKDDELSYSLGLQYALNDETNVYASYNRGYKAGGVNLDQTAVGGLNVFLGSEQPLDPIYDSEIIDSYELGAKFDWLGGAARTNLALFYSDVQNLQVSQFNGLSFLAVNAGDARSAGLEVEHQQQLTDSLAIDLAFTYLAENQFGDSADLAFLAGRDLPRAPELAVNLGLSFNAPVSSTINASGRIAYEWRDEHFTEGALVDEITQEAYGIVNLTLGLDFADRGYKIEAFCRNCADEDYVTVHFNQPIFGSGINGYLGDPRTFGLQLRGDF